MIGLPVMVMEFSIGRASHKSIAEALRMLEPKGSKWHLYGPIAIAGNYLLMMFYTVITGWLICYFIASIAGGFTGMDATGAEAYFAALQSDPIKQTIFMAISVAAGFIICMGGLRNGVERASKVMMLGLLAIMLALVLNSLILPGGEEGLRFYLVPDIGRAREAGIAEVVFAAMSQAFFTLSVGMGGMEIFGSYIGREQSLTGEAARIITLDTCVALMAGLIIFPA